MVNFTPPPFALMFGPCFLPRYDENERKVFTMMVSGSCLMVQIHDLGKRGSGL